MPKIRDERLKRKHLPLPLSYATSEALRVAAETYGMPQNELARRFIEHCLIGLRFLPPPAQETTNAQQTLPSRGHSNVPDQSNSDQGDCSDRGD